MENSLRAPLRSGDFLLGSHINSNDPTMTECMGQSGLDYLWIDTEHAAIDYHTLQLHLIAASSAQCPAIVRVPWNEPYLAKRVLEMGPAGIVFPMIRSVSEAEQAIASCLYPPRGNRSYGPIRAAKYGAVGCQEFAAEVPPPCCFLQVEHIDAVRCIDGILDLPGLDGIIFGPCDLSGSLNRLGALDDPELAALIDHVLARCSRKGVPAGISLGAITPAGLESWRRRGIRFLSAGNEYSFVMQGISNLLTSPCAEGGNPLG